MQKQVKVCDKCEKIIMKRTGSHVTYTWDNPLADSARGAIEKTDLDFCSECFIGTNLESVIPLVKDNFLHDRLNEQESWDDAQDNEPQGWLNLYCEDCGNRYDGSEKPMPDGYLCAACTKKNRKIRNMKILVDP